MSRAPGGPLLHCPGRPETDARGQYPPDADWAGITDREDKDRPALLVFLRRAGPPQARSLKGKMGIGPVVLSSPEALPGSGCSGGSGGSGAG